MVQNIHPDGKYIYFCSTRTGNMQVWRMDPDGKNQTQLTFDELNNWFPHVSPDNKWLVFISFPKEVPADKHPFYQRVYLRLMPVAGGEAKSDWLSVWRTGNDECSKLVARQ